MSEFDCDVLIVGYGPVGQALAILLGQQGHRVTVVERWSEFYPRPRAVHFDDEIARVLASLGLGDQIGVFSEPSGEYDWQNANGQTLLHFDWEAAGASGWPSGNMFSQPALEAALGSTASTLPSVELHRGWQAVGLLDEGSHVEVEIRTVEGVTATVRAAYVVGCDGANSFVRNRLGCGMTDLGFFYDWLIVDVIPSEQRVWKPFNLQMCDPARPTTVVSGGPGRRRWEFMRRPEETVEELNTEETAWRLLEPWDLHPGNAVLERHVVYTFQARWADRWRSGRVLLAGDAAHLMPPFAGQGMCSGIRDAANLAWKLDLVLRGRSSDQLLDSYGSERSAHVQHAIGMSVELGNVICLTDPSEVAARDEIMLKAQGDPAVALPPIPPPVLGIGVLNTGSADMLLAPAGQLSGQARVTDRDGNTGLFDQVIGKGFIIAGTAALSAAVTPELLRLAALVEARLVQFAADDTVTTAEGVELAVDVDNFYIPHMENAGHEVVIVRPDFYLFGASDASELPALLKELMSKLHLLATSGR